MAKWKKPEYDYSNGPSLAVLLRQWMRFNKGDAEQATSQLRQGNVDMTQDNWEACLRNKPPYTLTTIHSAKLEDVTGIDLDRVMVTTAKREILKEHKELVGIVTFQHLQTRDSFVEVLLDYCAHFGNGSRTLLAMQIKGASNSRISAWIRGSRKPGPDLLKNVIIAVSQGLLGKPACPTISDVHFLLASRMILGCYPDRIWDGMAGLRDGIKEFFAPVHGQKGFLVALSMESGIETSVLSGLRHWGTQKQNSSPVPANILLVLRTLFLRKYPHLVNDFDKGMKKYLASDSEITPVDLSTPNPKKHGVKQRSTGNKEPAPSKSKVKPEAKPTRKPVQKKTPKKKVTKKPSITKITKVPETKPGSKPRHSSGIEDPLTALLVREAVERLRLLQPELLSETGLSEILQVAEVSVETGQAWNGSLHQLVGTTIGEVQHCLVPGSLPQVSGEDLDPDVIEQIVQGVSLVRQMLTGLASVPPEYRMPLMTSLRAELNELFIAAHMLNKYEDLKLEAARVISEGIRQSTVIAGERRGKKGS